MNEFVARLRVILAAAPTWLTAVAVILTAIAEEVSKVAPEGSEPVVALIVTVVAWIGAALSIVRRVTPVLPSERGVLPKGAG